MSSTTIIDIMEDENIVRLPLRDKDGNIAAYTIIDSDDYDKIKDYSLCKRGSVKLYAFASKGKSRMHLHHLILTKPEKGYVIDHINGDSLDNRKSNLQIASHSQNNQNREKKKGCASNFIGVWKNGKNWCAKCCNVLISTFEEEEAAAKAYDIYAYLRFGCNARTNNLIEYEECKKYQLEEFLNSFRNNKALPTGISIEKNKFTVGIKHNGKLYRVRLLNTLEEAKKHLDIFKKIIQELKNKEYQHNLARPIVRNTENVAIIPLINKDKDIVAHALVSDEDYHDLLRCSWNLCHGYAVGRPKDRRKISMHSYLFTKMNTETNDVIDHINRNKLDNRRENLRANSHSGNSHNSFKTATKGVRFLKGKWRVEITKDKKYYYLGTFNTEIEAAIAYNNKATELYGEFASLNIIPNIIP